jgi:hypothetical protein
MATTLPVDSAKEGNVWCESCQQSLAASRAGAHLASKKHLDKSLSPSTAGDSSAAATGARAGKKDKTTRPAATTSTTSAASTPKERKAKRSPELDEGSGPEEERTEKPGRTRGSSEKKTPAKAPRKKAPAADDSAAPPSRGSTLPPDPKKEGNQWCNICKVSLTPTKASTHLETARHLDNERKTLAAAMRGQ